MDYTIEQLKQAIIDVLDGENAGDIKGMTGFPIERCEELYTMCQDLIKEKYK